MQANAASVLDIVTGNRVLYEKDLGANTSAIASAMAGFHKDATWRAADE
jgi:Protein of unknown function (DUF2950)